MTLDRPLRWTIAIAASALVLGPVGPAAAARIGGGTFSEQFSEEVVDFCGVAGLAVRGDWVVDGRFLERLQGRDQLFYAMDNTRVVLTWTNLATGRTATDISPRTTFKDLRVTDNGDGTITVLVLGTGGGRLLGHDGKQIASNAGQVRFEVVLDAETGEELSFEPVFGSTGTNDDYCTAILADWGVAP